ncbi:hypothetical protein SLS62_011286 [Diatrype stigma]|uniref:Uncharacterized protein n=1 Tax=Diatrype stigma TaxID=117547 RepID=A0AAN9UCN3_9PEZI
MALVPPVERDGFSFAGGDLYAEASGHNRHRRATPAELEAHFGTGSDRDHPAHWFEAQLLHYGLPPSKTKAVARMRLYDAVRAGAVAVPPRIRALEADLKKQWTKNEREAKKALGGGGGGGSTTTAKKGGTKRKAESEVIDLTVSVGGVDIKVSKSTKSSAAESSAAASAAKKAKTTKSTTTTAAAAAKATTPKAKPASKSTTTPAAKSKTPASTAASKSKAKAATPRAPSSSASTPAKPAATAKKQTARRGGLSQGPGRGSTASSSAGGSSSITGGPPRTKQTARRGGGNPMAARRGGSSILKELVGDWMSSPKDDAPPPPYSEFPEPFYNGGSGGGGGGFTHISSDDDEGGFYNDGVFGGGGDVHDDDDDDDELQKLGLLNGRYAVYSSDVTSQWGEWEDEDFELVLTLAGQELWGRFDLGVVSGVVRLAQRPLFESRDRLYFSWRGREHEGPMLYGDGHEGWFRFLGGGRIEGSVDFLNLAFRAERLPSSTTKEVAIGDLRYEWNGYNEREYEEESRARWG